MLCVMYKGKYTRLLCVGRPVSCFNHRRLFLLWWLRRTEQTDTHKHTSKVVCQKWWFTAFVFHFHGHTQMRVLSLLLFVYRFVVVLAHEAHKSYIWLGSNTCRIIRVYKYYWHFENMIALQTWKHIFLIAFWYLLCLVLFFLPILNLAMV